MYYEFVQQNKRKIIYGIGIFLAAIIIWAMWTFIDQYGKIPLVVSVVPNDASVTVGQYKFGGGTHYIPAGDYQASASKAGFETETKSIKVTNQKDQNVLAISLVPKSSDAKKWADQHQADYLQNEQYGGIEAKSNGEFFAKLHPITQQLPVIDPYYKITYVTNKDSSISLVIATPSPRYRYYAIAKLRSMGYDPADFVISFKDFHNPLEVK